jgi:hypothetical protein
MRPNLSQKRICLRTASLVLAISASLLGAPLPWARAAEAEAAAEAAVEAVGVVEEVGEAEPEPAAAAACLWASATVRQI